MHDESNSDRQRWAYIYEPEEIVALIESLNPLGERESQLLEKLITLRHLIVQHVRKCSYPPLLKFHSQMISETSRKYNKSNIGLPIEHLYLNEVMYSLLVIEFSIRQWHLHRRLGTPHGQKHGKMESWCSKQPTCSACNLKWKLYSRVIGIVLVVCLNEHTKSSVAAGRWSIGVCICDYVQLIHKQQPAIPL